MTSEPLHAPDARHVLVVEDEPRMRAMLTDNLEFEGYRVKAVASGEEAMSAVEQQPFSLLGWYARESYSS